MQTCPNCGFANRLGVVFCENCGTTLIGNNSSVATRALTEKGELANLEQILDSALPPAPILTPPPIPDTRPLTEDTRKFPAHGSLRLEIGEGTPPIILLPKELIIFGRRDAATGTVPDVDLTPFAGYRMGVSRRHAEFRFDLKEWRIELWDLGSSNGTFLNGDRLIAHKGYRVRDGDQVRFGQLVVKVRFQKKDQ